MFYVFFVFLTEVNAKYHFWGPQSKLFGVRLAEGEGAESEGSMASGRASGRKKSYQPGGDKPKQKSIFMGMAVTVMRNMGILMRPIVMVPMR